MEGDTPTYCVVCGLRSSKATLRGQEGWCNCARQEYILVVMIETDEHIIEIYTDEVRTDDE